MNQLIYVLKQSYTILKNFYPWSFMTVNMLWGILYSFFISKNSVAADLTCKANHHHSITQNTQRHRFHEETHKGKKLFFLGCQESFNFCTSSLSLSSYSNEATTSELQARTCKERQLSKLFNTHWILRTTILPSTTLPPYFSRITLNQSNTMILI